MYGLMVESEGGCALLTESKRRERKEKTDITCRPRITSFILVFRENMPFPAKLSVLVVSKNN